MVPVSCSLHCLSHHMFISVLFQVMAVILGDRYIALYRYLNTACSQECTHTPAVEALLVAHSHPLIGLIRRKHSLLSHPLNLLGFCCWLARLFWLLCWARRNEISKQCFSRYFVVTEFRQPKPSFPRDLLPSSTCLLLPKGFAVSNQMGPVIRGPRSLDFKAVWPRCILC